MWPFGRNSWKNQDPELWRRIKELKKETKGKDLVELVLEVDFNRDSSKLPKYNLKETAHNEPAWLIDTLSIVYKDDEKSRLVKQIATIFYDIVPGDVVESFEKNFADRYFNFMPCLKGIEREDRRRQILNSRLVTCRNAKLAIERQIIDVADKLEKSGIGFELRGNYLQFLHTYRESLVNGFQIELDKMYCEDNSSELCLIYRTRDKSFKERKHQVELQAGKEHIEPEIEKVLLSVSPEDI